MAYIRPHKSGWRAEVVRNGRRTSKVFEKKPDAVRWAVKTEAEFLGKRKPASLHTLRDALERYSEDESPKKKGRLCST